MSGDVEPASDNRLDYMTPDEKLDAILRTMWAIQESMSTFVAEASDSPIGKMLGIKRKR